MPTDVLSRLAARPVQFQRFEQFASEAVATVGNNGGSFIVALRNQRAVAMNLPGEANVEKTLVGAAAQDAEVRASFDGGYARFLESVARSRHRGKLGAVSAALAEARKRGVPLSSRRILEVARCLERQGPIPAYSTDEHAGAGDGRASGTSSKRGLRGEEGTASGKNKKRKKSRVQVALNTLRAEGEEAFKAFVGDEIGEAELLRRLLERIGRMEDLGDVRNAALGVVQGRLEEFEPEAGSDSRRRSKSEPGRAPELATFSSATTELNLRERRLFEGCVSGNVGKVRRLLRHGKVDINMSVPDTLLCLAAYLGHAGVVAELLPVRDIDVNLAQAPGATPLYLAVQQGHVEVVKLLLGVRGINVNLATSIGATPLFVAAQKGRVQMVELLLAAAGVNVNAFTLAERSTPLLIAIGNGHEEVASRLLASPDIELDWRMDAGTTALSMAAHNTLPGIVEKLIEQGADVNQKACCGSTALCVAASVGDIQSVRLLSQVPGILVNRESDTGVTPVAIAAQNGYEDIVRLLLGQGGDPNVITAWGLSSLHAACLRGHATIVEMLLDAGADMDTEVKTPEGKSYSPYAVAELAGHQPILRLLEHCRRARAALAAQASPVRALSLVGKPGQEVGRTTLLEPAPLPGWSPTGQLRGEMGTTPVVSKEEAGGGAIPAFPAPDEALPPRQGSGPAGENVPPVPPSPLAQAKDRLRHEVLGKLADDNLEPLEGIRLLENVNAAADLDSLCVLYNRLAHIERLQERARRRGQQAGVSIGRRKSLGPAVAPVFSFGERKGLNAEQLEVHVKRHLDQAYHRFVSQAVNDLEFGRGKRTSRYPGLWHASAGIPGVGSCSVFYYSDEEMRQLRIVGIGHHAGCAAYRLDYATGELGEGGRILRLF